LWHFPVREAVLKTYASGRAQDFHCASLAALYKAAVHCTLVKRVNADLAADGQPSPQPCC